MKNKTKILLSITTCFALNLLADDTRTNLGEISIIDTALEAQIKSITSEKLENLQASDIKDILKSMPSVTVDGNARYSQKVYVRGLEDKSSNITIDGAKISGQLFHHSGDQTIDAEMLKVGSIELGANSALSGSGAINGSFVYETKDPSDYLKEGEVFGGQVSVGYQSGFDRISKNLSVFSKLGEKVEVVAIGNISEDKKLSIPDSEDIVSKQSELKSGLFKVVFKPTENQEMKFSYNKYEDAGERQLDAEKAGSTIESDNKYSEISRDSYALNYKYTPDNDLINLTANIYASSQKLEIEGQKDESSYWLWAKGQSHYSTEPTVVFENETKGFDLRNTSLVDNHKLTYGISLDKEEQSSQADSLAVYTQGTKTGETVDLSVSGGKSEQYGLYLEDEIDLDKLLLTFGARYDVHKLGGVYSGKNSQVSPKFKAQYQVTDNFKLRFGYGRIFKGPSLGESLLLAYGVSKNTDTPEAQTGNNFEIGVDYDLKNALSADNSIVGITLFKYNVDNYMHPTKNLTLTNQSNMKIWGVETVFRYEKDALGLSLSHTYTGGEAETISTGDKYDPLTAKIHTFKASIDYDVNSELYLNYNAEFVPGNKTKSEYYSYYTDSEKRSGYGVHNIAATYSPANFKDIKMYFGVDNIFDKKYQRHTSFGAYYGEADSGSYEVGRNYKLKFSYRF
ncbi:TonB-dependent receptor [Arcobacteraceae bacterium]|nr:TonB-dependent receptor [Arcobacteraceae bacterium]